MYWSRFRALGQKDKGDWSCEISACAVGRVYVRWARMQYLRISPVGEPFGVEENLHHLVEIIAEASYHGRRGLKLAKRCQSQNH